MDYSLFEYYFVLYSSEDEIQKICINMHTNLNFLAHIYKIHLEVGLQKNLQYTLM